MTPHIFKQQRPAFRAVFIRFSLGGGGSEFRLAMTDRATIAGMEVAKLVLWNSLLNLITSVSIEALVVHELSLIHI